MSTMPTDTQGFPIPTLGYLDDAAHQISLTSSSARNSTAFNSSTRVITLYATTPAFVRLGSSSVTAATTDHYFPAGVYYDVAIGPGSKDRYLAALRAETDGTLYISERQ